MGDMDQGLEYIAKQNIPDLLEVSEEYFGDLDNQRQPPYHHLFPGSPTQLSHRFQTQLAVH
jgi:hypothetical protein